MKTKLISLLGLLAIPAFAQAPAPKPEPKPAAAAAKPVEAKPAETAKPAEKATPTADKHEAVNKPEVVKAAADAGTPAPKAKEAKKKAAPKGRTVKGIK